MKGGQESVMNVKVTMQDMNLFEALTAAGYARRINPEPDRIAAVGADNEYDNNKIVFCKDDRVFKFTENGGTHLSMADVTNELKGVRLK